MIALTILFFAFAYCKSRDLDEMLHFSKKPTLGEECELLAEFYYKNFVTQLPSLSSASEPGTVSSLRKSILRLRDVLDVCVFSYEPDGKDDKIMDIRQSLDDGYTAVGAFKDLEFVSHTPEEKQALLLDALDWVRHWNDKNADHHWEKFFLNPMDTNFADREYSHISGYYWKIAEKKPKTDYHGDENLARLAHYMCEFVLGAYKLVKDVKDVTELDNHDEFHDFRKTLRSIDFVSTFQAKAGLTDSIWDAGFDYAPLLSTLNQIYTLFGNLNDDIYSYLHDEESGVDKDTLKKRKEELNQVWSDLKVRLDDELHPVKLIEAMEKGFIKFD